MKRPAHITKLVLLVVDYHATDCGNFVGTVAQHSALHVLDAYPLTEWEMDAMLTVAGCEDCENTLN